jgi:hypothetical protein
MANKDNHFDFTDPIKKQKLTFQLVPIEKLSVISFQRQPSKYHIKHLVASIERIGFIVPLVVTPASDESDKFVVIDGQHRLLAAKEVGGLKVLPVIVVPSQLAQLMMNLNIEKELNIREKANVSLALYREYLNRQGDYFETEPELIDAIEAAYYVTLGLAYEEDVRLNGSTFVAILKKCDEFLEKPLSEAYNFRRSRAKTIIVVQNLLREIAEKLKAVGKWHPYIHQQILAWANPVRRKRLPIEFDDLFTELLENLEKIKAQPEKFFATFETE